MGFLDKVLKGAVNAIEDAVEKNSGSGSGLSDLWNQAVEMKDKALNGSARSGSDSGTVQKPENPAYDNPPAAKPPVEAKEIFYDEDDEMEFSFMLSGDFVYFNSGAGEIDYAAAYAPDFNPETDDDPYEAGRPCFLVVSGAENEVYNMIENFKQGKEPTEAMLFLRVTDLGEKVYFKAKMKLRGQILYYYALDRGTIWKNNYIGMTYAPEIMGTALEKKLMVAVDEAVRTYKEVKKVQ